MKNNKKHFIFHPFLIVISPILFFYSQNSSIYPMAAKEAVLIIAMTIFFSLLLWLSLNCILKDRIKASIVTSFLLIWFLCYGFFYNFTERLTLFDLLIGRHRLLILIWTIFFAFCIVLIIKNQKNLKTISSLFNNITLCLLIVNVLGFATQRVKNQVLYNRISNYKLKISNQEQRVNLRQQGIRHDIYYIILDGYARNDILRDFFDFDNTEFTGYLINKGFYIADKSQTNYPITILSLASSLNMEHLLYLKKLIGCNSSDLSLLSETLHDNKVLRLLKSCGYKIVNIGAWGETRINKYADLNFYYKGVNRFSVDFFAEISILNPFFRYLTLFSRRANAINYSVDMLARTYSIKGPKFVFAHIFATHNIMFDKNGEVMTLSQAMNSGLLTKQLQIKKEEKEKYLNCVKLANKQIKYALAQILSNSSPSPIIVLQADHGPPLISLEEINTKMSKESLRMRMGILNAFYLPEVDKYSLYRTISPVNSFRLILNIYFGTKFDLLNDESYIFSDIHHPYNFINVTDRLK